MSNLLQLQDEYDKERDRKRIQAKHKAIKRAKKVVNNQQEIQTMILATNSQDDDDSNDISSQDDQHDYFGEKRIKTQAQNNSIEQEEQLALALLNQ